jgi:hypothetical protein
VVFAGGLVLVGACALRTEPVNAPGVPSGAAPCSARRPIAERLIFDGTHALQRKMTHRSPMYALPFDGAVSAPIMNSPA